MTLIDFLVGPFSEFAFMKRALVGGLALSLSAPPVGVFLMLRRMSLVGDAMTHAILPGAALGYLAAGLSVGAMTLGGLLTGLAVALLSGLVARVTTTKEDASFAAFHLIALALGVALVSLRGSNIDLLHILFGSVLALDNTALTLLVGVAIASMFGLALIFRPLVMESVDPDFVRSVARKGWLTHILFLSLIVLNLIAGFHALGTLMAVGIMVLPAVTARFWSRDLTGMIASSIIIAMLAIWSGLLVSYHLDLPSGPSIVLMAGLFYVTSIACGWQGGLIWQFLRPRHLEA